MKKPLKTINKLYDKGIVDDEYSKHWQEVLEFLQTFSNGWNRFIKENNIISNIDFKTKMIDFNAEFFEKNKPENTIIFAGVNGNTKHVSKLIKNLLQYENLVYSIVGKYGGYFDKDDLYQAGMLGLIDAYKHFNTMFFSIYFAIAVRETFQPIPFAPEYEWGMFIWILASFSGFWVHGSQCQLADYYRNIHLYFINEKNGNEFHNSIAVRKEYNETPWKGNFFWKLFLNAYVAYVENQERMTPRFQRFIKTIQEKYGTDIPQELRNEFRKGSLPLMKYANILTFNSRAIMLCVTMLIGEIWFYLFFELVILMILFIISFALLFNLYSLLILYLLNVIRLIILRVFYP